MKLSQRRGRLRLQLDPVETEVLANLLGELSAVVQDDAADDAVVKRLFPAAYPDDDTAQADYRSMTEASLRDERVRRIEACVDDLDAGGVRGSDLDLADPDDFRRWLQTLNDLRLAIGTRIGVTEDDPPEQDDDLQPRVLYHWLTALQDCLVTAHMS